MAGKKFQLRVITPAETKVDEQVEMVIMRCIDGDWGVMAGHDMRSGVLDFGAVRIINEGIERRLAAYGGIAEVQNDVLTILTHEVHWPEDINRELAKADRDYAEKHLREKLEDADVQKYGVTLRRALVQIEVSSYTMVGK